MPAMGQTPAWSVVPRVSATQTFTDNATLSTAGKQGDQITEISPGIRLVANAARLKGSVDYSLRNFISAQASSRNNMQNSLLSNAVFEAVDKWLYLDASATISQQTISAFGTQSVGAANTNANRTETSNFRLSPYVRGKIAGRVDYLVRYAYSETQSKSTQVAGTVTNDFSARLSGTFGGPLGWVADASSQTAQYGAATKSQSDRLTGRLTYRYDPELTVFVSAGTDSNNYSTSTQQSSTTSGYGGDWTPTERTRLTVTRERRSFGNSHSITFNHRLPLSAVRFTDSRSITTTPNQTGVASQGTYYDLYYSQLASSVPDPAQRAQQVLQLLQQAGISPTAAITNGYLTSRVSVQRRQELAVILNGLRNTATYTFFQTASESAGTAVAGAADDFSRSQVVRTVGMSSNFSHRLTPFTSINTLSSWTRSSGSLDSLKTTQKLFSVNVATRLTAKSSASFGLRSTVSEGATTAYRENAVFGTITAQF